MNYQEIIKEMERKIYEQIEKNRKREDLEFFLSRNIIETIIKNNDLNVIKIFPATYAGIKINEKVIIENNKIWLLWNGGQNARKGN